LYRLGLCWRAGAQKAFEFRNSLVALAARMAGTIHSTPAPGVSGTSERVRGDRWWCGGLPRRARTQPRDCDRRPPWPWDRRFLDRSPLQSAADVESARTHFPVFERNFMSAQEQLDVFVPGRRFPAELSQSHNFHRPAWPLCRVHTNMLANI